MYSVSVDRQGKTAGQKSKNFSENFIADYLVIPNNLLTHTHTHDIRTYCSVTLFCFFLRAREKRANLYNKEFSSLCLFFMLFSLLGKGRS